MISAMPKKTRKEKILAAYRKKLRSLEQPKKVLPDKNYHQELPVKKSEPSKKIEPISQEVKNFFPDLRKSLILIILIIALEIGLYFARLIK